MLREVEGLKFHKLTITKEVKVEKGTPRRVECICDCGKVKEYGLSAVKNGTIKSCGCLRLTTGVKDVTGEIFGRLKVISTELSRKIPSGKREKQVKVLCECGVEKVVDYVNLKRGDTKSCGCLSKDIKLDIVKNNIFGSWTILSEGIPYEGKKGKTRTVNVQCVCGKKKSNVTLNSITQGKSNSCGCKGLPKKIKEEKVLTPIPVSTEEEQWKEAFGFEGYFISTKGNIFSSFGKRGYLKTDTKTRLDLNSNGTNRGLNIARVVYQTFVGEWDENEYTLLYIDDNIFDASLNNLFLARLTTNKTNWVSRAMRNMDASSVPQGIGQLRKERNITKRDIIDLYKEQEGLSFFLKLPMDLTGKDELLGVSVDRINNEQGYIKSNVKLVTRFENMGRRTATFDSMIKLCNQLKYTNNNELN